MVHRVLVELDLRRHCVRTEVRRCYEQALSDYFRAGEEQRPELEERIELLREMLEDADLAGLRASCPELAGGADVRAQLMREETGRVLLRAGNRTLEWRGTGWA